MLECFARLPGQAGAGPHMETACADTAWTVLRSSGTVPNLVARARQVAPGKDTGT
jgi:hypothetical protein